MKSDTTESVCNLMGGGDNTLKPVILVSIYLAFFKLAYLALLILRTNLIKLINVYCKIIIFCGY